MATVVNTVTGPVSPDELGITLMHEHILYGYPGWEGDQTIAPFDRPAIVKNAVGIRSTGIRAGVIKVGTGKGVITDYEAMMLRVAARVQKETGVPIITHTQEGTMGPDQAALLIAEGAEAGKIQIGQGIELGF